MKPNMTVSKNVQNAKRRARNASSSPWMTALARLGYAAKGVVYLIIGWLAALLAIGHGGSATDQRGAIQTIYDLPFGRLLLAIVAIGLLGFALWSLIQAAFDSEGKGSDAKGILARLGYVVICISYLLLAFGAYQLVIGGGNTGKSSTITTQDWTAQLLKYPFGVALVVVIGLVVLGVACYLFYKAYAAPFRRRLNLTSLSTQTRKWVIGLGRFGYAALGVVFVVVGIFLIVAASQHNPRQAKGLDTALQVLAHQPFGAVLLGVVALGLIAYGVYSFVEARYRRVGGAALV